MRDRKDRRVPRIIQSTSNRVERLRYLNGHPHRIYSQMRSGRMAGAIAMNRDQEPVDGRRRRTIDQTESSGLQGGVNVIGKNGLEPVQYALLDHHRSPTRRPLFIRLEEDAYGTLQVVPHLVKQHGDTNPNSRM